MPAHSVEHFYAEAGVRLLEALDKANFEVKAAFWMFGEESEEWRLYIASPVVSAEGPRAAYAKVLDELKKLNISVIGATNVSLVDPADSLVQLLSRAIRTGDDVSKISFQRNAIDGVYIPAAYIYRMNP